MKNKYPVNKEFKSIKNFKPPLSRLVFPFAKIALGAVSVKSDDEIDVTKIKIKSTDGKFFTSFLIKPKGCEGKKLPCLVYLHGGGFVYRAAPYHYRLLKKYCVEGNFAVLAADYRLSPKYKFPTALFDTFSAFSFAIENAETLGVDKNLVAVGGDSAGGNLAAACCLLALEKGFPTPLFALLVYPVLDAEMKSASMKEFVDTPMWNAKLNKKIRKLYLEKPSDKTNPLVSPIYAKDLSSFPPTYVETAEFDCLRDEGKAFAKRLSESGVDTLLFETKGTVHGFEFSSDGEIVQCAVKERIAFMKRHFRQ